MPDRQSDPPVTMPPIKNDQLVITAGPEGNTETLTINMHGKKLTLVVKRGDAVFTTPIDGENWSLKIS